MTNSRWPEEMYFPLFKGPTIPPMTYGVTLPFFVFNFAIGMLCFVFVGRDISSFLYIAIICGILFYLGRLVCRIDPHFFDVWNVIISNGLMILNYKYYRCNVYIS